MHDDIMNLSPEAIWGRSSLPREMIDRILAAPNLPFSVAHNAEALRLTLAKLADIMVLASAQRPLPVTRSRALLEAFEELCTAWTAIEQHVPWPVNRPPPLPGGWVQAMQMWGTREFPDRLNGSRKPDNLDQEMYPRLLAFFTLAYDRRAAATSDGPTIRFLQAFLRGMAAAFAPEQADPVMTLARPRWRTPPTTSALVMKVRTHLPASLEDRMTLNLFEVITHSIRADIAPA